MRGPPNIGEHGLSIVYAWKGTNTPSSEEDLLKKEREK